MQAILGTVLFAIIVISASNLAYQLSKQATDTTAMRIILTPLLAAIFTGLGYVCIGIVLGILWVIIWISILIREVFHWIIEMVLYPFQWILPYLT